MPISLLILMCLLYSGIPSVVRRVKLSRLKAEDFPDVDAAIFVRWKQAEVKRIGIILWLSWGTFGLQIALLIILRVLYSRMSRGDIEQLDEIVIVVQMGYIIGSFILMFACFGEGNEQQKLRVEARVKSFYSLSRRTLACREAISAEPFAAQIDITHVLGLKTESGMFMSNTRVTTKTYRISADLLLRPPNELSMAEGAVEMNESVYLTCPQCGEQLASYVDYAAYARIQHTAVSGDGALRKSVARYILTHGLGLDLYWVAFLSTSIMAGISAGGFLHGFSPFWLFWLLFVAVDIALFGIFVGLLIVFINSNIRRRDTLLRLPEITKDAISILEHKDTSPVICVSGVEIESAQGGSHELRMLNSKNNKRDMWGQTRIDVGPADYGNFGLPNPYYPKF